jgi:hypothetical protein
MEILGGRLSLVVLPTFLPAFDAGRLGSARCGEVFCSGFATIRPLSRFGALL